MQEVFLSHVRLGHVLEQQQVAMKISKASPGEMQTFWVVCSMLAQVACARRGSAVSQMQPEMLLKLAGALAGKQLQAEGVLSYEALLVYMDVLQAQGDLDRCMELLDGPSAAAVQMPHELARLKVSSAAPALLPTSVQSPVHRPASGRSDRLLSTMCSICGTCSSSAMHGCRPRVAVAPSFHLRNRCISVSRTGLFCGTKLAHEILCLKDV